MGIRAATVDGRKNHRRTENAHRGRTHGRTHGHTDGRRDGSTDGCELRTRKAGRGAGNAPNAHRRADGGSGERCAGKARERPQTDGGQRKPDIYNSSSPPCWTAAERRKSIYIYTSPPPLSLRRRPDPGAVFHMWDTNKTPKTKTTRKSEKNLRFVLTS